MPDKPSPLSAPLPYEDEVLRRMLQSPPKPRKPNGEAVSKRGRKTTPK